MTTKIPDTDDDEVCVLLTVSSAHVTRKALGNVSGFDAQHLAEARLELERANEADDDNDVMRFWFDPEIATLIPSAVGQYALKRRGKSGDRTFHFYKRIAMSIEDQLIRQGVAPW